MLISENWKFLNRNNYEIISIPLQKCGRVRYRFFLKNGEGKRPARALAAIAAAFRIGSWLARAVIWSDPICRNVSTRQKVLRFSNNTYLNWCHFFLNILINCFLLVTVLCSNRVSQMTKTYNDIEAVTRLLEEVNYCTFISNYNKGERVILHVFR